MWASKQHRPQMAHGTLPQSALLKLLQDEGIADVPATTLEELQEHVSKYAGKLAENGMTVANCGRGRSWRARRRPGLVNSLHVFFGYHTDPHLGTVDSMRDLMRFELSPRPTHQALLDPLAYSCVSSWLLHNNLPHVAAEFWRHGNWDNNPEAVIHQLPLSTRQKRRLIDSVAAYRSAWREASKAAASKPPAGAGDTAGPEEEEDLDAKLARAAAIVDSMPDLSEAERQRLLSEAAAEMSADSAAGAGAGAPAAATGPPDFQRLYDEALPEEDKAIRATEDALRRAFVADRETDASLKTHPHPMLVPAHAADGTVVPELHFQDTPPYTRILNTRTPFIGWRSRKDAVAAGPSVVNRDTFASNWQAMTRGSLEGLDWTHLFAAGGSCLACLLPGYTDGEVTGCNGFASSDIDLFVVGCDTDEQANAVVANAVRVITANCGGTGDLLVSNHSITLLGVYPQRHVQFVLRRYLSPVEVLAGFDVDCCSVGFDGTRPWLIPRSRRAVATRTNVIDVGRRSLTYESRLLKYSDREFAVGVPGLDMAQVNMQRLQVRPWVNGSGLPRLLACHPRQYARDVPLYISNLEAAKAVHNTRARIMEKAGEGVMHPPPESDYGWVMGWGFLTGAAIEAMYVDGRTDIAHVLTELEDGSVVRLCKINTMFAGEVPSLPVSWLTENPGRQLMTGSFHPIDGGDWWGWQSWTRNPEPGTSLVDLFFKPPILDMAFSDTLIWFVRSQMSSKRLPALPATAWKRIFGFLRPKGVHIATPAIINLIRTVKAPPPVPDTLHGPLLHSWIFAHGLTAPPARPHALLAGSEATHSRFSDFIMHSGDAPALTQSIMNILRSVCPGMEVSAGGLDIIHSFVNDIVTRLGHAAAACATIASWPKRGGHTTILQDHVIAVANMILPPEMANMANSHAQRSANLRSWDRPHSRPTSVYGLVISIHILAAYLRNLLQVQRNQTYRVSNAAAVHLTGILEFLMVDLLQLSAGVARDFNLNLIMPRHIMLAARSEKEMDKLTAGVTFVGAGVLSFLPRIRGSGVTSTMLARPTHAYTGVLAQLAALEDAANMLKAKVSATAQLAEDTRNAFMGEGTPLDDATRAKHAAAGEAIVEQAGSLLGVIKGMLAASAEREAEVEAAEAEKAALGFVKVAAEAYLEEWSLPARPDNQDGNYVSYEEWVTSKHGGAGAGVDIDAEASAEGGGIPHHGIWRLMRRAGIIAMDANTVPLVEAAAVVLTRCLVAGAVEAASASPQRPGADHLRIGLTHVQDALEDIGNIGCGMVKSFYGPLPYATNWSAPPGVEAGYALSPFFCGERTQLKGPLEAIVGHAMGSSAAVRSTPAVAGAGVKEAGGKKELPPSAKPFDQKEALFESAEVFTWAKDEESGLSQVAAGDPSKPYAMLPVLFTMLPLDTATTLEADMVQFVTSFGKDPSADTAAANAMASSLRDAGLFIGRNPLPPDVHAFVLQLVYSPAAGPPGAVPSLSGTGAPPDAASDEAIAERVSRARTAAAQESTGLQLPKRAFQALVLQLAMTDDNAVLPAWFDRTSLSVLQSLVEEFVSGLGQAVALVAAHRGDAAVHPSDVMCALSITGIAGGCDWRQVGRMVPAEVRVASESLPGKVAPEGAMPKMVTMPAREPYYDLGEHADTAAQRRQAAQAVDSQVSAAVLSKHAQSRGNKSAVERRCLLDLSLLKQRRFQDLVFRQDDVVNVARFSGSGFANKAVWMATEMHARDLVQDARTVCGQRGGSLIIPEDVALAQRLRGLLR